MTENVIELKTVRNLLGMNFLIPNYQRGYRWTGQQVRDLLNDVWDYYENDKTKTEFYCLQPLVIRRQDENILEKIRAANTIEEIKGLLKGSWEVIDGQQRLTTIFIILSELGEKNIYHLKYATRDGSERYLMNINNEEKDNNIDYFHIFQSKRIISEWFDNDDDKKSKFKEILLNDVKFIWYESVNEDPIKVFTRLNIGKISLTNAELIKALVLNRSNFISSDIDHLKLRQQEIATEWDIIEYSLQNEEFWLFLNNIGYKRPTRIDFIFDMICDKNKLELDKDKYKLIGTDEYRTFRYFYEYFKSDNDQLSIKKCWKKVKAYYQTFREWFNDLELYHYIGYLVIHKYNLYDLMDKWNNQKKVDKKMFVDYLKKEIKKEILKKFKFDQTDIESDKYDFIDLVLGVQYKEDGSDKKKCKPILLFHSIQTVVNQNNNNLDNEKYQLGVFYKFPFHLYKLENWDVEHINSNTTNEEDDPATQNEWLLNVYLSADEETQSKICEYFKQTDTNDKKILFNYIKDKFPQTEDKEWTSEEKNKIWNYTLLDSSTNRSYGNAIFSGKRRVIIGKDKGQLIPIPKITKDGKFELTEETKAKSSFVPPCTKQVFMKYYSSTMSDANYWTKIDAKGYQNDIENCLKKLED